MTPAARVATAAAILDEIIGGVAAEKALTGWARRSRYAGSRDRAAIRDLVFDGLRCLNSFGWLGGGSDGRAVMLGRAKAQGDDLASLFSGDRYALEPLTDSELSAPDSLEDAPRHIRLDVPEWTIEKFEASLGAHTDAVLEALRTRAPVTLRVNTTKAMPSDVIDNLTLNGFEAVPHPLTPNAVVVEGNTRGLVRLDAFLEGRFEFQDAASQAAVHGLADIWNGATVLDFCAGGGGKSLAVATYGAKRIVAHDIHSARMKDLPVRAARAGADVSVTTRPEGQFDVVLCDVPCSGSGAWRRQPDAKWQLTAARLKSLQVAQSEIIDRARKHVSPGGHIVYMTCSLLDDENEWQISEALQRHGDLVEVSQQKFTPLDGCDGFFVAVLRAKNSIG